LCENSIDKGEVYKLRTRSKRLVGYLKTPLLAGLTILAINCVGMLIASGVVSKPLLVLLLFLEGGAGLLAAVGVSLSATPSISRLGQVLLGTAPWSKESERHAERVGWKWMIAASLLIGAGFVISVL
jgi:hypothetical protein